MLTQLNFTGLHHFHGVALEKPLDSHLSSLKGFLLSREVLVRS